MDYLGYAGILVQVSEQRQSFLTALTMVYVAWETQLYKNGGKGRDGGCQ